MVAHQPRRRRVHFSVSERGVFGLCRHRRKKRRGIWLGPRSIPIGPLPRQRKYKAGETVPAPPVGHGKNASHPCQAGRGFRQPGRLERTCPTRPLSTRPQKRRCLKTEYSQRLPRDGKGNKRQGGLDGRSICAQRALIGRDRIIGLRPIAWR